MSNPIVRKQSYGKSQVRVSRIHRDGPRHEFIELSISISLDGEFETSYSQADNSKVVATDSMKNTVYVLASRHGIKSVETFAQLLGKHFLATYLHVDQVEIECEEKPWAPMMIDGKPHDHAFLGGFSERNTCHFTARRTALKERAKDSLVCGINGLQVLKTTGSGFANFFRDEYTTLPETDDRIFATTISASWNCNGLIADWTAARAKIRAAILEVFAKQYSKSVQHTLYEMARAAFAVCPLIDEITIRMPNQHHLLANLTPFNLKNPNEVFVPTSEPFGNIGATISRGEVR